MWELDHKEGWTQRIDSFWPLVLEKALKSPLNCKEIKPVNPKGNQSWIFIGRTDAEAPVLWPPDAKSWLIRKDADAGKDWRQEEKRITDRGWNGWMASLTQWTWVWASFRRWWRTVKPGVLLSMRWQRVRHDWVTEHQQQRSRYTLRLMAPDNHTWQHSCLVPKTRVYLPSDGILDLMKSWLMTDFPVLWGHGLSLATRSLWPVRDFLQLGPRDCVKWGFPAKYSAHIFSAPTVHLRRLGLRASAVHN